MVFIRGIGQHINHASQAELNALNVSVNGVHSGRIERKQRAQRRLKKAAG